MCTKQIGERLRRKRLHPPHTLERLLGVACKRHLDRFEVEVAYGIGIARPVSLSVDSFGTGTIPDADIQTLVERHFDLRPASIIAGLELRRPIYRQTAAYGHFGREDLDLPWERTDKAALLAEDAGLPAPETVSAA